MVAENVSTEGMVAKARIVAAVDVVYEHTFAEGGVVFDAVRWVQKREAGEERNKNQRECVRFHIRGFCAFALHTAVTK